MTTTNALVEAPKLSQAEYEALTHHIDPSMTLEQWKHVTKTMKPLELRDYVKLVMYPAAVDLLNHALEEYKVDDYAGNVHGDASSVEFHLVLLTKLVERIKIVEQNNII